MVENVVRFAPELQPIPLREPDRLVDVHMHRPSIWSAEGVARRHSTWERIDTTSNRGQIGVPNLRISIRSVRRSVSHVPREVISREIDVRERIGRVR